MNRRLLPFASLLLAASASAQTLDPFSAALDRLRAAVTRSRAHSAVIAAARPAPAPAPTPTPAGKAALACRDASGHQGVHVSGTLDLGTMALDKSRLLDAALGAKLIDERCGTPAAPISSSLNYDVTSPHVWGEDILQLPKYVVPGGAQGFKANLHTCSFDGDWSASNDVTVLCNLTVL